MGEHGIPSVIHVETHSFDVTTVSDAIVSRSVDTIFFSAVYTIEEHRRAMKVACRSCFLTT